MRDFMSSGQQDLQRSSPTGFLHQIRLVVRLLRDNRVSMASKLIIPGIVGLYLLWPVDLLPDVIPLLGQLDDIALLALGAKLFVDFCPPELVRQHRDAISGKAKAHTAKREAAGGEDACIDAEYRVIE